MWYRMNYFLIAYLLWTLFLVLVLDVSKFSDQQFLTNIPAVLGLTVCWYDRLYEEQIK